MMNYDPEGKGLDEGDIPAEELDEVDVSLLGSDVGWDGAPLPLLVDVRVVLQQESGQLQVSIQSDRVEGSVATAIGQ